MIKRIFFLIISATILFSCFKENKAKIKLPDNVFSPLVGKWHGHFFMYDRDFKKIRKINVKITYKKINKDKITGQGLELHPDGKKIKYSTVSIREEDLLMCTTDKSGEKIKMLGSFRDGAFIWMWSVGKNFQIYHERVIENKKIVISGYGIYSGKVRYMRATYNKINE